MDNVEDLISNLAQSEAAYKHLWELTAWDKKFSGVKKSKQPTIIKYNYFLAGELIKTATEIGDVKLLGTGAADLGVTTEEIAGEHLCEGEIVAIPWGGTPRVQYYKGKFVTGDNRIATSRDIQILNNKFLYYWMSDNLKLLTSFYRGGGLQHPNMAKVLDMRIPVPSLRVQEKMVSILDIFTEMETDLKTELEARRKQFKYYRNKLLTFKECAE